MLKVLSISVRINRDPINAFELQSKGINTDKTIFTLLETVQNTNHRIPKSDLIYHLISPYNVIPEPHIKVKRIKEMITNLLKKLLIVKLILLVSTLGNVQRTVWRICTMILGCTKLQYKVKQV